MRISLVVRYLSFVLLVNAAFMLLSAGFSVVYGAGTDFFPLLLSAFITSTVGCFPLIFVPQNINLNTREIHFFVVLAWLLSCVFGMLPYILWGGEFSIVNAWFESVSGYTTTGASILTDIESVPKGLLFWRSSTHYIGGVGVVLFALLVLQSVRTTSRKLTNAELSQLARDNYRFKTNQTIRVILTVYIGITIVQTILLMLFGMNFFDAINHAFSTVATGGFSTKNSSVLSFQSVPIGIIFIIFMLISGMHFGLIYSAVMGRSKAIFRSPIIKFYLVSVLVGSVLVTIDLCIRGVYSNVFEALYHATFQIVSTATTTGFATVDTSFWPAFSICVLIYFYIQCACAGSTSGGVKVDRVYIFFKSVHKEFRARLYPNAIVPVRMGNVNIDKDLVASTIGYIVLYMMIIFLATLIMLMFGLDLMSGFSTSLSFLGNVGPAFGDFGSSLSNFNQMPDVLKVFSPILMLLGRLEIYGFFLMFAKSKF